MKIKLISLIIPAFILAPAISLIERYIFADWAFALTMAVLVATDTFLGSLYAWKTGKVSSKGMLGLFIKVIVYGLTLITVHGISHHTVNGQPNSILASVIPYFDSVMYTFILLREFISIDEKCGKLGYPLLPKYIRKRLLAFDENGMYVPETAQAAQTTNNEPTPTNPTSPTI